MNLIDTYSNFQELPPAFAQHGNENNGCRLTGKYLTKTSSDGEWAL